MVYLSFKMKKIPINFLSASSAVCFLMKVVFPTPESPTITSLNSMAADSMIVDKDKILSVRDSINFLNHALDLKKQKL